MSPTKPLAVAGRTLMRHHASTRGSFAIAGSHSSAGRVACNLPIAAQSPASFRLSPPCGSAEEGFQRRPISTTAPKSVVGWVQEKIAERNKLKMATKTVDQINLMANSPAWTAKFFLDELDAELSQWMRKIPGMDRDAQVKVAKEIKPIIEQIIETLGEQATFQDIAKLDRKGMLKLAVACKKPMSEVEKAIDWFQQKDMMHRIIRYRKEKGIALPTTQEGLMLMFQQDAGKVMTKREKEEMAELYQKRAMSQMGMKED